MFRGILSNTIISILTTIRCWKEINVEIPADTETPRGALPMNPMRAPIFHLGHIATLNHVSRSFENEDTITHFFTKFQSHFEIFKKCFWKFQSLIDFVQEIISDILEILIFKFLVFIKKFQTLKNFSNITKLFEHYNKFSNATKIFELCKNIRTLQKFLNFTKIFELYKNFQNSLKIFKLYKNFDLYKNFRTLQNFSNVTKFFKLYKNFQTLQKFWNFTKILELYKILFEFYKKFSTLQKIRIIQKISNFTNIFEHSNNFQTLRGRIRREKQFLKLWFQQDGTRFIALKTQVIGDTDLYELNKISERDRQYPAACQFPFLYRGIWHQKCVKMHLEDYENFDLDDPDFGIRSQNIHICSIKPALDKHSFLIWRRF